MNGFYAPIYKIKLMLNRMDIDIKGEFKNKICFSDKGILEVSTIKKYNHSTYPNYNIILDEAAFLDKNYFNVFLGKIMSEIKPHKKIIITSTPNGIKNKFFDLYYNSMFESMSINYKDNPRFTSNEKWYDDMEKIIPKDKFRQEIHGEFVDTKLKAKSKPKNKNKLIQFRVDDDLYVKLSSKLMKDDVSVSTYMRNLIIKDMDV
jgi:hypothetical protein